MTEWHGWPPQVWNGTKWVYIPEATLIVLLTTKLLALRKGIGAMTASEFSQFWFGPCQVCGKPLTNVYVIEGKGATCSRCHGKKLKAKKIKARGRKRAKKLIPL